MGVTIRDVAKLAGASVASVSAALNGSTSGSIRVSDSTRTRIRHAAAQLGYVSNPIAKSLATGRTGVVGLMLPYADAFFGHDPFSMTIMRGVMRGAVETHRNVMLYSASEGMSESRIAMMIDTRVDGLVLVIPEEDGAVITKLEHRGIPYVSVLRRPAPGAWTVNSDDYEGGRLATQHLLNLGHRRLLHLKGDEKVMTTIPRCRGFLDAAEEAGAQTEVIEAGFDWKGGREAGMSLLRRRGTKAPTAVFCANDFAAQGFLMACDELGVRAPDDIAVVGYDDTHFAETMRPRLTTVHMGVEEMGVLALENLTLRIENPTAEPQQSVLPVRLTVRESCGASLPRPSPTAEPPSNQKQRGTNHP
jgi:LacI family transcriptional regulator